MTSQILLVQHEGAERARLFSGGGLLLCLLVLSAGCQKPEPEPLTFRYHLPSAPRTLDPARGNDLVERLGERFGRQPVGSGPYRIVEAVRDFRIVLTAFGDHASARLAREAP